MAALSLPMEYNITGFSVSATTSRMTWMLSASRRWRCVRFVMARPANLVALDVGRGEVLVLGARSESHLGGFEHRTTVVLLVDHLHVQRAIALVLGIEQLDVARDQLLQQLAVASVEQTTNHHELG